MVVSGLQPDSFTVIGVRHDEIAVFVLQLSFCFDFTLCYELVAVDLYEKFTVCCVFKNFSSIR